MLKLLSTVYCGLYVLSALAQGAPSGQFSAPPLPQRMTLWYYPDALNGRRGHQLDIEKITQNGSEVTAVLTMFGLGMDRCRLQGQAATGSLEGNKLVLKVKVEAGDNLTCGTTYELQRGADGQFEGTYRSSGSAGTLRRR